MKAREFFEWALESDYCFKTDCHELIAKDFDKNCEVDFSFYGYDEPNDYGTITRVIFSDGSLAEFNYKGESE